MTDILRIKDYIALRMITSSHILKGKEVCRNMFASILKGLRIKKMFTQISLATIVRHHFLKYA